MFQRLPDANFRAVTLTVDGRTVMAGATDSVAAALIAAGIAPFRTTPVSGAPRAPFDCLVTIDGVGSRQACLVRVRDGMRIETQHGKREAGR